MELKLPPPNLQGNYEGSCAVCLSGTDSGLSFTGEAEWAIGGLSKLGIPEGQAYELVRAVTGADTGKVVVGIQTVVVRICTSCAEKTGVTVGVVAGNDPVIPNYRQSPEV